MRSHTRKNASPDLQFRTRLILLAVIALFITWGPAAYAQAARGSQSSPTFVNYGGKKGAGDTVEKGPKATDLHIVFNKGGVGVKDAPNSEEINRKTANGDEVDIIFKKPIDSAGPPPPQPPEPADGSDYTPPADPPPGTSYNPTFDHADPQFPGIKTWWWTHKKWVHSKNGNPGHWQVYEGEHHEGNP
jgi:hypothetical protein